MFADNALSEEKPMLFVCVFFIVTAMLVVKKMKLQ